MMQIQDFEKWNVHNKFGKEWLALKEFLGPESKIPSF